MGQGVLKYVAAPRTLYMGDTPSKTSDVGSRVRARMLSEGKYRPDNGGEVASARTAKGAPLAVGAKVRWVSVAQCDMGHIVDAVAWWNSNGCLLGAQAGPVLRFMADSNNYEFEPLPANRARGARIGARYVPPAV